MNHQKDGVPHMADGLCQYAHQYNNKVLICKVRTHCHGQFLRSRLMCFVLLSLVFYSVFCFILFLFWLAFGLVCAFIFSVFLRLFFVCFYIGGAPNKVLFLFLFYFFIIIFFCIISCILCFYLKNFVCLNFLFNKIIYFYWSYS